MKRREFLQRTAALSVAAPALLLAASDQESSTQTPRRWNLFDVAWIEHAGMCVCVRAGTDETAVWQMSDKWERALREDRFVPRKFIIPVRTAAGISQVTYVATEKSLALIDAL